MNRQQLEELRLQTNRKINELDPLNPRHAPAEEMLHNELDRIDDALDSLPPILRTCVRCSQVDTVAVEPDPEIPNDAYCDDCLRYLSDGLSQNDNPL